MPGKAKQVEDGNFSRIHNDILQDLATQPLTGSEFRCVLFLLRKTYGYSKKSDRLSLSQWVKGTRLGKRTVIRTLQALVSKKIFIRSDNGANRAATYQFNKYEELWKQTSDIQTTSSTSDIQTTSFDQTSDIQTTKTSDIQTTHKRKKERKTTTGAATPVFPDREAKPKEQVDRASDVGLSARQLTQNTNTLLDITGLRKLADAGHDGKLRSAQDAAILLARIGYGDKEQIRALHDAWRAENHWRSNPIPSLNNLMEFASAKATLESNATTPAMVNLQELLDD